MYGSPVGRSGWERRLLPAPERFGRVVECGDEAANALDELRSRRRVARIGSGRLVRRVPHDVRQVGGCCAVSIS